MVNSSIPIASALPKDLINVSFYSINKNDYSCIIILTFFFTDKNASLHHGNCSQRTFTIIQHIIILIQNNIYIYFLFYNIFIMKETPKITLNSSKCTLIIVGYHCFTHTNSRTISRTWMDFKMADTSERRVF